MRLFLAFALPDELRASLMNVIRNLESGLPERSMRWVPEANLHVTAVFLGEVDDSRLDDLERKLSHAVSAFQPFEIACVGLGCFPNSRRPRVLWAGVKSTPPAEGLMRALASASQGFGSHSDENSASMHVTLARARDPRDTTIGSALQPFLQAPADEFGRFISDRVTLYRSQPRAHGSRYSVVREFPLLHD